MRPKPGKLRIPGRAGSRGFTLILVIGLLAVMFIYAVTVQSSVKITAQQGARQMQGLDRAEAATALATQAASGRLAEGVYPALSLTPTASGTVRLRALASEDPLWNSLSPLRPRQGDLLLEVGWSALDGSAIATDTLVVNRRGLRPGMITLPAVTALAHEASADADGAATADAATTAGATTAGAATIQDVPNSVETPASPTP